MPPVTALRSPPGFANDRSRLARDRRLVDAGRALDHVAVAGDDLAGFDADDVALAKLRRADHHVLVRHGRACALACRIWFAAETRLAPCPRPSATASAKFAKSTVNHSQIEIAKSKPAPLVGVETCVARSRKNSSDVTSAPTSTVNMTGLRICQRGSSFRNDARDRRTDDLGIVEGARFGAALKPRLREHQ